MPFKAGFYYSLHEGGKTEQKPVILIHGAGSSHLFWPAEIRRLTDHTVIALDLPGHGHSDGVGFQSVSDYSGAITEFLAAMGIFKAAFVGHSLGAAIALQLALDFPQHVIGIGVVSGGANFNLPPELITYLSGQATAAAGQQMVEDRLACAFTPQSVAKTGVKSMLTSRPSVLYGDWLACSRFDLQDQVNKINTPAYIACGREDRLTTQSQAHYLSTTLPIARLEVIHNAGHLLPMEQPILLAAGLKQFIDDLLAWHANYPLRAEFPSTLANVPRSKNNSSKK